MMSSIIDESGSRRNARSEEKPDVVIQLEILTDTSR
jgi:hypothetical protein